MTSKTEQNAEAFRNCFTRKCLLLVNQFVFFNEKLEFQLSKEILIYVGIYQIATCIAKSKKIRKANAMSFPVNHQYKVIFE